MIIETMDQLSKEWFGARCGIPTASKFNEIVTSDGGRSKQRKKYLYTLAGDRITESKEETFQFDAMKYGIEMEGEARGLFELVSDMKVDQVGICYYNEKKRFSMSPDGLINDSEGLEIKCPKKHTHIEYLLKNKLPSKYVQQVQGSMFITGYKIWWFMSYYPGLPPLIIKIDRDETFIQKLSAELYKFCNELDEIEQKLRDKN